MKEQFENAKAWIKKQDIRGCITGSTVLGYFEKADIDIFVYDQKSFDKLFYAMYYNDMFTILDEIEIWKANKFMNEENNFRKFGLTTLKFYYNTCVPINIILKKDCTDIFSVLSTFDLDIVCKGYDIKTGKYLDLSENLPDNKATWNKWNPAYSSDKVWEISRVLKQFLRVDKYQKRKYDMSEVVLKYKELLNKILDFSNIFNSESFDEKLETTKKNALILDKIIDKWLIAGSFTEKEVELANKTIKLL